MGLQIDSSFCNNTPPTARSEASTISLMSLAGLKCINKPSSIKASLSLNQFVRFSSLNTNFLFDFDINL